MKNKAKKLTLSFLTMCIASSCYAGVNFDTPQGKLSIGGNFEFNEDFSHINNSVASGTDAYNNSGRVELNMAGEHDISNGMYGAFSLNPGWLINGNSINDMWMGVGKKNDWFFKMGHYLASDVSPVGLGPGDDTWVGGYEMYTVNDAKGRASNMATFSKFDGSMTYELTAVTADDFNDHESTLNTLPGQNTTVNGYIYTGSGITSVKNRNPFVLRPVAAWNGGKIQAAVGGEFNMVTDAYIDANTGASLSKRNGFGGYVSYNFTEDFTALVRSAYLDAVAHNQMTAGPGFKYKNFYFGYLFGREHVEADQQFATITKDMHADAHEVYLSSVWKNFAGIDNMEFHAGGYWTQLLAKDEASTALAKPTDFGARFRIKYFF
jgi:hypothetical protein